LVHSVGSTAHTPIGDRLTSVRTAERRVFGRPLRSHAVALALTDDLAEFLVVVVAFRAEQRVGDVAVNVPTGSARMRRRSVLLDIDVDKERGCVHRVDGVVDRVEVALRLGIVDVGAGDGAGLDERLDLADGEQQVGSAVVVVVVAPTSMSTVAPRRSTSSWR
jgi:hypothetical protein